jgi:chaperonin GroEL (HSP60 family)
MYFSKLTEEDIYKLCNLISLEFGPKIRKKLLMNKVLVNVIINKISNIILKNLELGTRIRNVCVFFSMRNRLKATGK